MSKRFYDQTKYGLHSAREQRRLNLTILSTVSKVFTKKYQTKNTMSGYNA